MNDIRQDRLIFKIFPIFTHPYIAIMRLDRPIGYMLLFYPISFSIFAFSDLNFEMIHLLFIFFIGSVAMRSAGCIINDLLDQDIDNKVERTKTRPLVSKTLSKRNSFFCLLILFLISFIVLIQLNTPSIILSLIIVPLVFLYPLAKRFFLIPQFILAFTYNWGCLIGWSSLNSPSDFKSILFLYFALILWTFVYDTVYATQDEEEDKKIGLYSSALFFGNKKIFYLNIMIFLQYLLILCFGYTIGYNILFFVSILFSSIVNLYFLNFLWKGKKENSNSYFKLNNLVGVLLLLSFILSDGI